MIRKAFYLSTLSISLMSVVVQAQALQQLEDQDLRNVNGQDGVYIETSYSEVGIDNLHWQDKAGSATQSDKVLRANANGLSITGTDLGTKIFLNAGTNAGTGKTGISLDLESHHSLIKVNGFSICDTQATAVCSPEIGSLALQSTSPIVAKFKTTDGLFNATAPAYAEIGLKNMHVYLGQNKFGSTTQQNQLLLKNFNFNFKAKGLMYIDNNKGFMLETGTDGYADLSRVQDTGTFTSTGSYVDGTQPTNAGLNLEFMLKKDVSNTALYNLDSANQPANAKGLIRVGANGRIVNGTVQIRGTDANGLSNNVLGNANSSTVNSSSNSVIGSTGIGMRLKADFTTSNDTALSANGDRPAGSASTLEIGGAGLNSYGFEFGNLTGLINNTRGSFDSGNVYINLVDTKNITIPTNYIFQNSSFGNGGKLTTTNDYTQDIFGSLTQTYALVTAIRGMNFQTFSRSGRFTNSANVESANKITEVPATGVNANKWGLALPFYNVNANIAMYGVEVPATNLAYFTADGTKTNLSGSGNAQRLGFSMAMTAEGVDKKFTGNTFDGNKGSKTTSILVLDGEGNYYMGLRNIDMLLKGTGTVGTENGSLNFAFPNLLIVMAGDVALGTLPTTLDASCVLNCTSFANNNDAVFGLKLRLGGNMQFSLLPNNSVADGSHLGIVGELDMTTTTGNTIQINDVANKSVLGLDNITGKLAFNNQIGITKYSGSSHSRDSSNAATTGQGTVHFNMGLTFNPDSKNCSSTVSTACAKGALRVQDLNLYPPSATSGQRLGEMAITGGTLKSNLAITPRAGSFSFN